MSGTWSAALAGLTLGTASGWAAQTLACRIRRAHHPWRGVLLRAAGVTVVAVTTWGAAGTGVWWHAAVLTLAAVAVPISAIDLAERRIPDRILLPAFAFTVGSLALDAAATHNSSALLRALLAAAVLYAGALAVLLVVDDSLGYGDVKALAYQGLCAGYLGWGRVLAALLLTFTAAAAAALVLCARHRRARRASLALAPYLLAATLAAVLLPR